MVYSIKSVQENDNGNKNINDNDKEMELNYISNLIIQLSSLRENNSFSGKRISISLCL